MPASTNQLIARHCLEQSGRFKGRVITHLIKGGKIIHTIKAGQKQPIKAQKTLTINNIRYNLVWVSSKVNQAKHPFANYS